MVLSVARIDQSPIERVAVLGAWVLLRVLFVNYLWCNNAFSLSVHTTSTINPFSTSLGRHFLTLLLLRCLVIMIAPALGRGNCSLRISGWLRQGLFNH